MYPDVSTGDLRVHYICLNQLGDVSRLKLRRTFASPFFESSGKHADFREAEQMRDFSLAYFPLRQIGDSKVFSDVVQELLVTCTFGFELHLETSHTHREVICNKLNSWGIGPELFYQDAVDSSCERVGIMVPC